MILPACYVKKKKKSFSLELKPGRAPNNFFKTATNRISACLVKTNYLKITFYFMSDHTGSFRYVEAKPKRFVTQSSVHTRKSFLCRAHSPFIYT